MSLVGDACRKDDSSQQTNSIEEFKKKKKRQKTWKGGVGKERFRTSDQSGMQMMHLNAIRYRS